MKNTYRIFGIYLLVALYGFAVGVVAHAPTKTSITNPEGQSFSISLDASAAKLYSLDVQIGALTLTPLISLDFETKENFVALLRSTKCQVLASAFTQYAGFVVDLRINLKKTKLLFPFHYFW